MHAYIHTYIAPVGYCTIKLATPKDRRRVLYRVRCRVVIGFHTGLQPCFGGLGVEDVGFRAEAVLCRASYRALAWLLMSWSVVFSSLRMFNGPLGNPKPSKTGDCAYALSSVLFHVQSEYRRRMAELRKKTLKKRVGITLRRALKHPHNRDLEP